MQPVVTVEPVGDEPRFHFIATGVATASDIVIDDRATETDTPEGYGEGLGWVDPETANAALGDEPVETVAETARESSVKVRRLVALRGSYTAEISGRTVMETR